MNKRFLFLFLLFCILFSSLAVGSIFTGKLFDLITGKAVNCDGCMTSNGECVDFGTRISNQYCDIDQNMKSQKVTNQACDNNFECKTDFCSYDKCSDLYDQIQSSITEASSINTSNTGNQGNSQTNDNSNSGSKSSKKKAKNTSTSSTSDQFDDFDQKTKIIPKIVSNPEPEPKQELCNLNSLCEGEENYGNCPEDCFSGSQDNYCDRVKDDICDLDCGNSFDDDCKKSNLFLYLIGMLFFGSLGGLGYYFYKKRNSSQVKLIITKPGAQIPKQNPITKVNNAPNKLFLGNFRSLQHKNFGNYKFGYKNKELENGKR